MGSAFLRRLSTDKDICRAAANDKEWMLRDGMRSVWLLLRECRSALPATLLPHDADDYMQPVIERTSDALQSV